MDLNAAHDQILAMSAAELRTVFEQAGGKFLRRPGTEGVIDVVAPPRPEPNVWNASLKLLVDAHDARILGDMLCGEVIRHSEEIFALIRAEDARR